MSKKQLETGDINGYMILQANSPMNLQMEVSNWIGAWEPLGRSYAVFHASGATQWYQTMIRYKT